MGEMYGKNFRDAQGRQSWVEPAISMRMRSRRRLTPHKAKSFNGESVGIAAKVRRTVVPRSVGEEGS